MGLEKLKGRGCRGGPTDASDPTEGDLARDGAMDGEFMEKVDTPLSHRSLCDVAVVGPLE